MLKRFLLVPRKATEIVKHSLKNVMDYVRTGIQSLISKYFFRWLNCGERLQNFK